MATLHVSASRIINAAPETVYDIIADYNDSHQRILPKPPFVSLHVVTGGVGAGTIIQFEMRVMGRTRRFQAVITEPEPGRVLVETDRDAGSVTTFTVDPHGNGSHVTIATEVAVRDGLFGTIERRLTTRFLQSTYEKELDQLARVAGNK
ncbi:MAG: SRPBCC family protein [Anaerolineae bacterium]|nr:SRPBCC family protein [Anaerolineae bacterium]